MGATDIGQAAADESLNENSNILSTNMYLLLLVWEVSVPEQRCNC